MMLSPVPALCVFSESVDQVWAHMLLRYQLTHKGWVGEG